VSPEAAFSLGIKYLRGTREHLPKARGQVHMVCVGVSGKEVLVGYNKYRTGKHLVYGYPGYSSVHAEFDFYRKALKRGFEPEYIIVLGERTNLLKSTRPCRVCSSLLLDLGFKKILFLSEDHLVEMDYKSFEELNAPEEEKTE
jgi:tRNA(Arg) A34 adenosine deaminase TadA